MMKKLKGANLIYSLLIVLILATGVVLYFYLLKPEMNKRDSLIEKYNYQQTHLEELTDEVDIAKKKMERADSLAELQERIPKSADLQSVMDDLDEVEYDSSTAITDIRFNNYDEEVDTSNIATPKNAALTEVELLDPNNEGVPTSNITKKEKPANLNLLTLELSVSAYEAKDINRFIKKITKLKRIYIVDSVKYANPNVEDGVITATIQVTTFNANTEKETKKDDEKAKAEEEKSATDEKE